MNALLRCLVTKCTRRLCAAPRRPKPMQFILKKNYKLLNDLYFIVMACKWGVQSFSTTFHFIRNATTLVSCVCFLYILPVQKLFKFNSFAHKHRQTDTHSRATGDGVKRREKRLMRRSSFFFLRSFVVLSLVIFALATQKCLKENK